jgi:CRP/FNR family transcriptional regulator, cyclic AMP receptor protein
MAGPPLSKLTPLPLFRGLTEAEAGAVAEISEEVALPAGQLLFREGDEGDALYVLLTGTVEVIKHDRGGAEQVLAQLTDGSVLGEMSLISGNAARSASVRATSDLKLIKVSAARFSVLLQQGSPGALKVVASLAQVLGRRLLQMDEKLVDVLDKSKRKEELAAFQKILTNWSF